MHACMHTRTHTRTHSSVLIWLAAGGPTSRNTSKQPARMRARTHARTHACANTLAYVATHANCPSTHAPQPTNSSATSTARMPQPATAMHGDERRPPSAVRSSAALAVRRACTCARCQHVAARADPPTTGLAWPTVGHRRVPRGQPPRATAAATTNERTRRPPSAGAQPSLRPLMRRGY